MFPLIYDLTMSPWERTSLGRWRARLVAAAKGRVLEIGAGTGRNLPHYCHADQIVLTDPDPEMLARARPRIAGIGCPVHLVVADAERLPFAPATFDEVIGTLVFCTIPHPENAIDEVRRVLKPGGLLRMLEHVRTGRPWVARLQDLATPVWKHLANGCHLNRRPVELALAHGFTLVAKQQGLDDWLIAAELRV